MISQDTENALIAAFRGDTSIFFEQHGFCMHINTLDDFPLGAAIHQAMKLLRVVVDEIEFESLGLPD